MQATSHILMIRPVHFGFNAETASNNAFQVPGQDENAQEKALSEFDSFVKVLRDNGVDVTVMNDTLMPHTPDSIFPNNWVSFHDDGSVCIYPMYAVNRRQERKPGILEEISKHFSITRKVDFSHYETDGLFLEGTGSMVLDRDQKIAYACLSPRTGLEVLNDFCRQLGYQSISFHAVDQQGRAIYHTNVMMCVADRYVVVCLDSIRDKNEREKLTGSIKKSGKQEIDINLDQMNHFAGNMLQVENKKGEKILVMSTQAYESLNKDQIKILESYNRILHASLLNIETNGGGSARCMMAEIHLPFKK
ncbi:MAG TPA: arginine deiminase-related protein [Puia sp.]|nr:arginine deiminase-related protein [Puia sp.]